MTDKERQWTMELAACRIVLAAWAKMTDAERKHLSGWLRKMLMDKDRDKRKLVAEKIAMLYGRPRGFSRRLRTILYERSISVTQFAASLGTTAKHASRWLAGDSSPSRAYRSKVAHVLDLDPEELSNADGDSIAG